MLSNLNIRLAQIDLWKRDIKFNLTIIIWKSWLMMNEVTLSYNNLQILTYINTSWKEILSDEVQLLTTCRPLPITTRRERKRNFWDLRIGSEVESSSRFKGGRPDMVTPLWPTCESPTLRERGVQYYIIPLNVWAFLSMSISLVILDSIMWINKNVKTCYIYINLII